MGSCTSVPRASAALGLAHSTWVHRPATSALQPTLYRLGGEQTTNAQHRLQRGVKESRGACLRWGRVS